MGSQTIDPPSTSTSSSSSSGYPSYPSYNGSSYQTPVANTIPSDIYVMMPKGSKQFVVGKKKDVNYTKVSITLIHPMLMEKGKKDGEVTFTPLDIVSNDLTLAVDGNIGFGQLRQVYAETYIQLLIATGLIPPQKS